MQTSSFVRCAAAVLLAASFGTVVLGTAAKAHPHVFVGAKAEIVYDAAGNVTAIRHLWTFDELYSSYASTGLDANKDGQFSRSELTELAKTNVESLAEFGYFSVAKSSGRKSDFAAPTDYWLEGSASALTLTFTLPLKAPVSGRTFTLEVYDPTFFVAFGFAETADALTLTGAPTGCSASVRRPAKDPLSTTIPDAIVETLGAGFGAQFATRATVACP